jgi:hypothetical protein
MKDNLGFISQNIRSGGINDVKNLKKMLKFVKLIVKEKYVK